MKIKQLLSLGITCLSLISIAHADETELGKIMDEVNDIFKTVKKDATLDNNGKAELVRKAASLYIDSVKHLPTDIQYLYKTDADKEVAFADYKAMIGTSYSHLCLLEVAYLKNDEEAIEQAWSAIKDSKKKGHKKYIDE